MMFTKPIEFGNEVKHIVHILHLTYLTFFSSLVLYLLWKIEGTHKLLVEFSIQDRFLLFDEHQKHLSKMFYRHTYRHYRNTRKKKDDIFFARPIGIHYKQL